MKVNPVSRAIFVTIVCVWLWSPMVSGQNGEMQPSRQRQRQKQSPNQRQKAAQQQRPRQQQKRDFIVEEGERQARMINSFLKTVTKWGPPFGIAFFVTVLLVKLGLGGKSFKKKSISHGSAHFA